MIYAETIFLDTFRAVGVKLQPFSLGHALLLQRLGSPFAAAKQTPGGWTGCDLAIALAICSRDWRAGQRMVCSLWRSWAGLLWFGLKLRTRAKRREAACAIFAYLVAAWTGPKVWLDPNRSHAHADPLEATYRTLRFGVQWAESRVLDLPLCRALWDACAYWQSKGALEIRTEGEEDILDQVRKMRAAQAAETQEGGDA